MKCHKCKHYLKGHEECLSCKWTESNDWQRFVHPRNIEELVSYHGTALPPPTEMEELREDGRRVLEVLKTCRVQSFKYLLTLFLLFAQIPAACMPMVIYIINGGTLTSYANSRGVSKQSVHQRWNRLVANHKLLETLVKRNKKRRTPADERRSSSRDRS